MNWYSMQLWTSSRLSQASVLLQPELSLPLLHLTGDAQQLYLGPQRCGCFPGTLAAHALFDIPA